MADEKQLVLYFAPPSSFSQKAVIALKWLKLKYESKLVNLFECEQLEPWYLDINPKGEVPTLVDGTLKLTDSVDILQHLNDKYDTKRSEEKLIPNPVTPLGRQVAELNQMLCTVKLFVLTFGVAFHPQHSRGSTLSTEEAEGRRAFIDKCVKAVTEKRETARSPYKECYTYKLTKFTTGRAILTEESSLLNEIAATRDVLRKINEHLEKNPSGTWLLSNSLTVADITLTVILFRVRKLGLEHHFFEENGQPVLTSLAAYRDRAFAKPFMSESLV